MDPLQVTATTVARAANVPTNRITAILNGTRGVSADSALRLGRLFRTTPEFWLNLQQRYDLDVASDAIEGLESVKPIAV